MDNFRLKSKYSRLVINIDTNTVKNMFYLSQSQTLVKVNVGCQFCLIQVSMAGAQMQLKDIVCNTSMLGRFLTVDGGEAAMNDLQTQLCDVPADILQEAERLFLSQLDLTKFVTVGISEQRNLLQKYISHAKYSFLSGCCDPVLFVYLMHYSKPICLSLSSERPSDG